MQSNVSSPATSPAESAEHRKSFWSDYQASQLSDLFHKPSSSPALVSSHCAALSSISLTSSPYLGKMTNSNPRVQTASRESCSNNLSLCEASSHDLPNQFASSSSPLVSHSESESPVDLHLYSPFTSNPLAHSSKICVHRNFLVKCSICSPALLQRSTNKLNHSPTESGLLYSSLAPSQLELQNKMNSAINPEALLGADTKHLFGASTSSGMSMGLGPGNPLAGHLSHISTSIAAGISGGVNPGLMSMPGSHLHHTPHHHASHQSSSIHSMASSSFTLHSHLSVPTSGQRASNRTKSTVSNKQFLCPICNKLFTQKGNLKTHLMIHSGEKPYACHVCGKSFTQKGNVDTHAKIHAGVKDYACESCGKSFTQKGNLKTHVRSVHTKEKPYACRVCGKSFSQKGNMHTHVRTHNKDDRFPCNLCGKTFSQKGNLKTHMQRHAGTLPKRYGPGGQRRQTTSRLLQVPVSAISGGAQSAAAAAAAAAYAIAAAGNAAGNLERGHPQSGNSRLNFSRNTPVSPDGGDNSRSPVSLGHGSLNGSGAQRGLVQQQQQSVIANVQNQQPSREQVENPSLYPVSSEHHHHFGSMSALNSGHLQTSQPNSFNLSSTPSAAAAAAAVLLSSTSGFSKDPKTNHLHFMSSLFH